MAGRIINPGTRAIYRGKQGIFAPGVGRVGGHDASLGGSSYVRAAYLGAVATRSAIPTKNVGPATTQIQSCSRHISLEAVPFQIEIPNWQVRADTFAESNSGATATCNASIEYPANSGTFTQVLFSGVATGTIGIGAGLLSDQISMAIPVGQAFNVRIFWQGNYEFWFGASTGAFISTDTSRGEFYRSAASGLTDHTMGGAVTDTGGGYKALRPTRIIGMTRKPTILTIGDSRCAGIADTFNDVGNYGEPARIFGSRAGLINVGVQGDSASKFVASHAKRVALGANIVSTAKQTAAQEEGIDPATALAWASRESSFNFRRARLEVDLRALPDERARCAGSTASATPADPYEQTKGFARYYRGLKDGDGQDARPRSDRHRSLSRSPFRRRARCAHPRHGPEYAGLGRVHALRAVAQPAFRPRRIDRQSDRLDQVKDIDRRYAKFGGQGGCSTSPRMAEPLDFAPMVAGSSAVAPFAGAARFQRAGCRRRKPADAHSARPSSDGARNAAVD
jgi:hypothetical protein